ncbi:hypothetical protein MPSEU_000852800 [Mayamaea pseudoterrestris]|nr:hypothetical protein MPSEU_000852800 [Mayamaea pseudoterrestris]
MKLRLASILLVLVIEASLASTESSPRPDSRRPSSGNSINIVDGLDADMHYASALETDHIPGPETSPVLEAFEKEIVFMVRDFGQDLRELVERRKQSVVDGDDAAAVETHEGTRRNTRSRRRRSSRNSQRNVDSEVVNNVPYMPSKNSFAAANVDDSRFENSNRNVVADTHNDFPRESPIKLTEEELLPSSSFHRSFDDRPLMNPAAAKRSLVNMVELEEHNAREADKAAADSFFSFSADEEANDNDIKDDLEQDPLRRNLVKKAINMPFSKSALEPMSVFMLQLPEEELPPLPMQESPALAKQAPIPTRNPFAKLFSGRRVESVVSLWTVDQEGDAATSDDNAPRL